MTEAEAQAQLHILYEGNNDTPSSTTSDYLSRRGLLNAGIVVWEKEEKWKELVVNLSDAADGDKTTTAAKSDYDAPTDFREIIGYVRIGTTYYPYYAPEKFQMIKTSDSSTKFYHITGNVNAGFKVNILPAVTSTGDTIIYEYFKAATELSATGTVFEMSDPYFAIYFALSKLYEQDGLSGESIKAFQEANARLEEMKRRNASAPFYQSNEIPDREFDSRGIGGFGRSRL